MQNLSPNERPTAFKTVLTRMLIGTALLPILFIVIISYAGLLWIFYSSEASQCQQGIQRASSTLSQQLANYDEQLQSLATDMRTRAIIRGAADSTWYAGCYEFDNRQKIRAALFVLDNNARVIVALAPHPTNQAAFDNSFAAGITRMLKQRPSHTALYRVLTPNDKMFALFVGRTVVAEDIQYGYLIYAIYRKDLQNQLSLSLPTSVYLYDIFDNLVAGSEPNIASNLNKLPIAALSSKSIININDKQYLMAKTEVVNCPLNILALSDISQLYNSFSIAALTLLILFALLTATIMYTANKLARRTTTDIDNIVNAIRAAQSGRFDYRLKLQGAEEFRIIADAYNQMTDDIQKLIINNREQAQSSAHAEIKLLESQFNPHFLFNTLEMIKYLARTDTHATGKVIVSLAALLRYSINNSVTTVQLCEDITYTDNYLKIQKYRLGKRLSYAIDIEDTCSTCLVPKLIIQPIIENAIKYGYGDKDHLTVKISAKISASNLVIAITDDGAGMSVDKLLNVTASLQSEHNISAHNGLHNIHRRINLLYGKEYGIYLHSEAGQNTVVSLTLPARRVKC